MATNDPNKQALKKNRTAIVADLANPDMVASYLFSIDLFNEELRDEVLVSIMKMLFLSYKRHCFTIRCS
jgi:hypothetical protein